MPNAIYTQQRETETGDPLIILLSIVSKTITKIQPGTNWSYFTTVRD